MNAGRELDAVIAERIMGFERCDQRFSSDITCSLYGKPDHWSRDWHDANGDELPAFSTDISAAFALVRHMHAKVYEHGCAPGGEVPEPWPGANYLTLSCLSGSDEWSATFCCIIDDDGWYEHPEEAGGARALGAPLAICLAALSAIGAARV